MGRLGTGLEDGSEILDARGERYEIIERAGAGGMSSIYRARQTRTGDTIAIKLLAPEIDRATLSREAGALEALSHPRIVRCLGRGTTRGEQPFLVLEWIEGPTLADRIRQAPLSNESVAELGSALADALAAVHDAGLLHGDVKPENVLLDGGSLASPKLIDFGIARTASGFQSAAAIGTPAYMAPEQLRGGQIDERTDLYGLGGVLYACATGKPPFAATDQASLLAAVLVDDPGPLPTSASAPMEDLVLRLLAKRPADRPRSARSVASQLRSPGAPAGQALTAREARHAAFMIVSGSTLPGHLNALARDHDLDIEPVADRLSLVWCDRDTPTTQVARVARFALALRDTAPTCAGAITVGRSVRGQTSAGTAVAKSIRIAGELEASVLAITGTAAALLDARFELRRAQRGYELVRRRDELVAVRTLLGAPSPFLGRDDELERLHSMWRRCAAGAANAALVVGPAGIGKTRLLDELIARVRDQFDDALVLAGSGDVLSAGSSFAPLAAALRRECGVHGDDERDRAALRDRVTRHLDGDPGVLVSWLGALLDLPDETVRRERNPMLRADAIRAAWQDWLAAEARAHPVLIVVDDLHVADLATIKLMRAALEHVPQGPMMVIGLARPEVRERFPDALALPGLELVELEPLSPQAGASLIREALGPLEDDHITRLHGRSGGNPFYLEELVRAHASGRAGDRLPDAMLAMVATRLDRLSDAQRRVLRAASIFGDSFWVGGLRALLGGDEVEGILDALLAEEVIAPRPISTLSGQRAWSFRHGLFREAVYATVTAEDRRLGHRLAGEWLESVGCSDERALAEHFTRGGSSEHALPWLVRAAEAALSGDDLDAAIAAAQRGRQCVGSERELGACSLALADACYWRAQLDASFRHASEAAEALEAGSMRWFRAVQLIVIGGSVAGNDAQVTRWIRAAAGASAEPDALDAQVVCLSSAAISLHNAGAPDLAAAVGDRAEALAASGTIGDRAAGELYQMRAQRAYFRGDSAGSLAGQLASLRAFDAAGDARNCVRTRINVGYAFAEVGQWARAAGELRKAWELADRLGLDTSRAWAQHNLGNALAHLGSLEEARSVEERAAASGARSGSRRLEGASRIYLARIALLANQLDPAAEHARRAAQLLADYPSTKAAATAMHARVLLASGDVAAALREAAGAMEVLEELGTIHEFEPVIRLVFAEALWAAGDRDGARRAIGAARDRILERASSITDQKLERSFLEAVPEHALTLALHEEWDE